MQTTIPLKGDYIITQSGWYYCIFTFQLLVSLCGLFSNVIAQEQLGIEKLNRLYNRADKFYNLEEPTEKTDAEALDLFLLIARQQPNKMYDRLRVESLIKAGNIQQGYGRFIDANKLYHSALSENKLFGKWLELDFEANLYLGSSMYFYGILDSAKFYFERTVNVTLLSQKKISHGEQSRLYNSLGAIYFESADYNQAIQFFKTALDLASTRQDDYNYFYTSIKSNIASCLIKKGFFDSAIQVIRSLEPKAKSNSIVFQPLAYAYFEKGDFQNSLKVFQTITPNSYLQKVSSLNYIGRIYMNQGNWTKAIAIFDSAISLHKNQPNRVKNKDEALTYLYRSQLAQKQGRTAEAISWINIALSIVHLNFKPKSKFDLPADIGNSVSPITFYQILTFKAALLNEAYQKEKNRETLNAALKTYILAFKTVNYIAQNLDNDDAKLFLISTTKNDYERALETAYEAFKSEPENAEYFLFILESYKGTALRQNIEFSRLKQIAGIPKEMIQREIDLKQLFAAYLTRLNLSEREQDSRMMQKRLTEIRIELSALQNSFKKYEIFSRLNQTIPFEYPVKSTQDELDGQTALLNYFVGEKNIYLLALTKQSLKIVKTAITGEYSSSLKSYMSSSLNLTEGSRYKGFKPGFRVFKTLVGPVYSGIKNFKKIIVIPDDYLFYLPFDALDPSDGNKDFLVRHHAISMHYSVSLLKQHNAFKLSADKKPDSIIAFAPFTKPDFILKSTNMPVLPFSALEVDNPRTIAFKGSDANKERFLKAYNKFSILHLATHGSLGKDSTSNWIQLFPMLNKSDSGRLFVHEIYNLNLSENSLVILSACETGAGLSAKGEGLLSLSRAFMYAGSNGIISTLYKTDDRVTAFLMSKLYYYLDKGIEPTVALQKSKIDLLNSKEINARYKSPNYWGNFVYIGKVVPTGYGSNTLIWILLPLLMMIIASIWSLSNSSLIKKT